MDPLVTTTSDAWSIPLSRAAIGFMVLVGSLAVGAKTSQRAHDYELRGEGTLGEYGVALAADGSAVVTPDRTGSGYVLHFDRVVDGEVNPEARISLGRYANYPTVAVRGELAVANVDLRQGRQLRFYAYANRTWSEVHRITMEALCSNAFDSGRVLGLKVR